MKTPIKLRLPASFSSDSADTMMATKVATAATATGTSQTHPKLLQSNRSDKENDDGPLVSTTSPSTARLQKENQRLSSEISFLQKELSAIVSKHALDKHTSTKEFQGLQGQVQSLAEDLEDAKKHIAFKDGALRVLEKQVLSKTAFIDELRGRIEVLLREKNEQEQMEQHQQQQIETMSSITGTTSFCHTFASPPPAPTVKAPTPSKKDTNCSNGDIVGATPKKQIMSRQSSGMGAGSIVRSTIKVSSTKTPTAPVVAPKTPPPFRSPSPTSRMIPRSKQQHYLPTPTPHTRSSTSTTHHDPSEGGVETPLTPSTRSTFLLMEQKKTIESLTRALIEKTEACESIEKEYEQFKTVVMQETRNAMILSPGDINMMKGPTNAEKVRCDSDEFELERSCDDGGNDGDGNREDRDDTSTPANNRSCNVSDIFDDKFIKKLDAIGLDLSMDIADLSALMNETDYVEDAAGYLQSDNEI